MSDGAAKTESKKLNTSTKPVGAPKSQFNSFSLEYSRLLMDDFVHGKFLTTKYTGKGQRFVVNGKEVVDIKKNKDGQDAPVTSNEVKYVQNVEGRSLEAKFDSKGLVRFWANLGQYDLGEVINFYAKVKTTKEFKQASSNLTAEYNGKRCHAQVRFDLKKGLEPYFNHKVILTEGNAKLGYVAKVGLKNFNLTRYNVFASYSHKSFDAYLEHISNNKTKISLGEIVAAGVFKHAGHTFVGKFSYDRSKDVAAEEGKPKPQPFLLTLASVLKVNKDATVRAKLDSKGELALSGRYKFGNNFSLVAGTRVDLTNPGSFLTGRTIPIPLGLQAEFTFN